MSLKFPNQTQYATTSYNLVLLQYDHLGYPTLEQLNVIWQKMTSPIHPISSLNDQFGFRPSGSTTCARLYMMHSVYSRRL